MTSETHRGSMRMEPSTACSASTLWDYIDILKDKTLLRQVAEAASGLLAMVQEGSGTGQDILEALKRTGGR